MQSTAVANGTHPQLPYCHTFCTLSSLFTTCHLPISICIKLPFHSSTSTSSSFQPLLSKAHNLILPHTPLSASTLTTSASHASPSFICPLYTPLTKTQQHTFHICTFSIPYYSHPFAWFCCRFPQDQFAYIYMGGRCRQCTWEEMESEEHMYTSCCNMNFYSRGERTRLRNAWASEGTPGDRLQA